MAFQKLLWKQVFLVKCVLKICSKFTGEHPCRSVISIKLQSNFIEIPLWHACSPVNVLNIFRTPFPKHTKNKKICVVLLAFQDLFDNMLYMLSVNKY